MKKVMETLHRNEKGFTLVELLIVVAIIAILLAIAILNFADITEGPERRSVEANLRTIDAAIIIYYADEGTYPGAIAPADNGGVLADGFVEWPEGPADAIYGVTDGTSPDDTLPANRAYVTVTAGGQVGGVETGFPAVLGTLPWD